MEEDKRRGGAGTQCHTTVLGHSDTAECVTATSKQTWVAL